MSTTSPVSTTVSGSMSSMPGSSSMSAPLIGSGSMIASSRMGLESSALGVGSSSSCGSSPCVSFGGQNGNGDGADAAMQDVDETLRPIDDWIKAFRRKNDMDSKGADMYRAAKAIVHPLLAKLKASQQQAVEQLIDSNHRILERVEISAVEYISQLLKVDQGKQEKQNKADELKNKLAELKDATELNNARTMAQLGVSGSSTASMIQSAIQSAGVQASSAVVSKIAQIVASASAGH